MTSSIDFSYSDLHFSDAYPVSCGTMKEFAKLGQTSLGPGYPSQLLSGLLRLLSRPN